MGDGAPPTYEEMLIRQRLQPNEVVEGALLQGLSDFADAGRLRAIEILDSRDGDLPAGAPEKLSVLVENDPNRRVRAAARKLLRKHGFVTSG